MNNEWKNAVKISAKIIRELPKEKQEAIFYLIDRRTIIELRKEIEVKNG